MPQKTNEERELMSLLSFSANDTRQATEAVSSKTSPRDMFQHVDLCNLLGIKVNSGDSVRGDDQKSSIWTDSDSQSSSGDSDSSSSSHYAQPAYKKSPNANQVPIPTWALDA
mmetsp:Transcript_26586/g.30531  ORF Transcript_26586/g.30531 Transcript_26586/m.30531 type:complete len:112 (-) Transcript_26586:1694-2029(-)|eukprot:CAMPEP_0114981438 /NCGR_PEP_ID=MMETSP0216-20121206/5543_1 /TAXON_ID=223996 /ORGANISM="Protocruzia adherens, Strain Boccale" /LENGTH=111 /DNA_ID=CAMNT_0002343107 /DNA_START=90 /DNA_END=425 /DNA_ORIENTATION=+